MYDERKEAAKKYVAERNANLAAAKEAQAQVIAQYMPGKMTPGQIADAIKAIIIKVGAKGKEDLNKVIDFANKQLNGKADPEEIKEIVIAELEDKPLPNA